MSNFELIQSEDKEYVANTYGRFPVAIEKGKGSTCYDFDGKKYIDFLPEKWYSYKDKKSGK